MNRNEGNDLDLISHYQRYFFTLEATTPELKNQAYTIRYQVYYEEHKMVSEHNISGKTETDIWDQNSIHSLLFHKPSNEPIGTIRIIPLATSVTHTLPLEEHYSKPFDFNSTFISHLRQGRTGEVSRMAILSSFRRRNSDYVYSNKPDDNDSLSKEKRFIFKYIPMYLAFSANILVEKEKLDYVVSLMEPGLARLLIRFGIKLKQIGEPMDYYGMRAPYLIFTGETYSNLSFEYKGLYDVIKKELIIPADRTDLRKTVLMM
ncbi:MAG: PEP-CTERM/exosortase system-associated acyltransferase [Gammaproteobacteria bacterium]